MSRVRPWYHSTRKIHENNTPRFSGLDLFQSIEDCTLQTDQTPRDIRQATFAMGMHMTNSGDPDVRGLGNVSFLSRMVHLLEFTRREAHRDGCRAATVRPAHLDPLWKYLREFVVLRRRSLSSQHVIDVLRHRSSSP